jgi:hypothetical protein
MIQLKGKTYVCSGCGWKHEEVDAAASLGPMLRAFSDPDELRAILQAQSRDRVAAALTQHETECPGRAKQDGA